MDRLLVHPLLDLEERVLDLQPLALAAFGDVTVDLDELIRLGWIDRDAVLEPHHVAVGMQQRHLSHESIGKLPGLEGGDESRHLLGSKLFRVEVGHLRDIAHAALGLVAEDGLVRLGAVQPRRLPIAHLHERHQVVGTVQQSEEVGARRRGHGQPCFSSTDVLPHVERRQRRRASTGEAEMRDVLFVLVRCCQI